MTITIGKCGNCGGEVQQPDAWFGLQSAPNKCVSCGAEGDKTANMPVLPMKPIVPKNPQIYFGGFTPKTEC